MAYKNNRGQIVTGKEKLNKKKGKVFYYQGSQFEYIGKTKRTGSTVTVLFEGKVLSEPDKNGIVKVRYLDRSLTRNPNKELTEKELPIEYLTII